MPMPTYYFETRHPLGRWIPAKAPLHPRVVTHDGVQRVGDGTGPRVQAISLIHPDHLHLSLDQLAAVYGPEGHLKATRPTTEDLRTAWGIQAEDSGNS